MRARRGKSWAGHRRSAFSSSSPKWRRRISVPRNGTPWSSGTDTALTSVTSSARIVSPLARIYVAGHAGLVGSALMRELGRRNYENVVTRTRAELDLTDPQAVRRFFEACEPEYVFLA